MIPELDPAQVDELAALASEIDGDSEEGAASLVEAFNRSAGTSLTHADFQGIYGGEEHEDFVRRVLIMQATTARPDLTRDELVELVQSVLDDAVNDDLVAYVGTLVRKTYGEPAFTDAVFWPDVFFGEDVGQPTAADIADTILERAQGRR